MNRIKTYVINLPKDQDRRESILRETSQYSTLDVEIVKAVYGKELTNQERENLFDSKKYSQYYGRSVLPGEIGCTLSHRKCYEYLLNAEKSFALILEDDAHFLSDSLKSDFWTAVEDIMNTDKPLVLLLQVNASYIGKEKFFCKDYKLFQVYRSTCTTGYLINKNAACLLLSEKRPYWVADDWFRFRKLGIDIYCVYPSVILQWEILPSTIQEKKCFSRKKRWLPHSWIECRLAYEKIIYMILKSLRIIKHIRG